MSLRRQVYTLIDYDDPGHTPRRVRAALVAVILLGIAAVAAGTMDSISSGLRALVAVVTGFAATVFLVEYLARLWCAPEDPRHTQRVAARARLRWAVSPSGLIDLAAMAPAVVALTGGVKLGAESAAIFVALWVLKLASHTPGVDLIARVARNERKALGAVMVLFLIVLLSAATLAHIFEGAVNPDAFGSIPTSLWWAIVTLTTAGYGDVIPQTLPGRMLAGVVLVCGVAVLALLAGILATGFADEVKRREFVQVWGLVARVPFFANVGAIAISDIVARLRSRTYPAGAVVARRGSAADAMYFIVSGEVEIRIGPRPVALRDGAFFGEMALLDRRPRSADMVTATPCTLLVLNVADFYQIAGQQPSLVAAIEEEAKLRRSSNLAARGA